MDVYVNSSIHNYMLDSTFDLLLIRNSYNSDFHPNAFQKIKNIHLELKCDIFDSIYNSNNFSSFES